MVETQPHGVAGEILFWSEHLIGPVKTVETTGEHCMERDLHNRQGRAS